MKPTPEELFGETESALGLWRDKSGRDWKLHRDIITDWQTLVSAADAAGFDLRPVSSWRSFAVQLRIFNEKFAGTRSVLDEQSQLLLRADFSEPEWLERILRYSALPGLSRHHWGTDLDVFDGAALDAGWRAQLIADEFCGDGPCAALHKWLRAHAECFGFFFPYANDDGGIAPEPWHLSHRASACAFQQALSAERLWPRLHAAGIAAADRIHSDLPAIMARYATSVPC